MKLNSNDAINKNELDEILRDLVNRIVEVAHPERIILFGSVGKRSARDDSDLDVLVVKDGANRRALAGRIYRNLIGLGRAVDIVVATPEDIDRYGQSPSMILYPALKEGRELYAA